MAELANTAPSSVVRACQRLGFRGYQEIKIEAAREAPRPPAPGDGSALAVALSGAQEALRGVGATVGGEQIQHAAEVLASAGRVLVLGEGLSGAVALDAAYRLRALGMAVDVPPDPSTAQLAAGCLPPARPVWPSATAAPPVRSSTPPAGPARRAARSSPSPATPVHR
ncbi:hypothetical protein [Kitasatospora cystarginea]|uniref:MurR/RpiR family transcriptional regulator n=1 Tax=Kitasatospora cystarginea TaxID=58350 RepID=UPI0031E3EF42